MPITIFNTFDDPLAFTGTTDARGVNDALQQISGDLCSISGACTCYRLRNIWTVLEPGLRDDL